MNFQMFILPPEVCQGTPTELEAFSNHQNIQAYWYRSTLGTYTSQLNGQKSAFLNLIMVQQVTKNVSVIDVIIVKKIQHNLLKFD